MKKTLIFIIVLILIVSLAGCNRAFSLKNNDTNNKNNTASNSSEMYEMNNSFNTKTSDKTVQSTPNKLENSNQNKLSSHSLTVNSSTKNKKLNTYINNNNSDSSINTPTSFYSNLSMKNTSIGWIVKDNKILRTEDGWKSYKDITPYKYKTNSSYDEMIPSGVYFYDSNTAWVSLGSYKQEKKLTIYHTIDGGEHWNKTYLPVNEYWEYAGKQYISFINNKTGFILVTSDAACGMMSKSIYKTIDGGVSWKKLGDITNKIASYPTGITFNNSMDGWITSTYHGQNYILAFKTKDGGVNWKKDNLQLFPYHNKIRYTDVYPPIFFKDNKENGILPIKYVEDNARYIMPYITSDGGNTWNIPKNFKNNKFLIYDFTNEKKWWAIDQEKDKLYLTQNSGENWKEISENKIFKNINYIQFVNKKVGFAIGYHIFIKTVDGGKSWIKIN